MHHLIFIVLQHILVLCYLSFTWSVIFSIFGIWHDKVRRSLHVLSQAWSQMTAQNQEWLFLSYVLLSNDPRDEFSWSHDTIIKQKQFLFTTVQGLTGMLLILILSIIHSFAAKLGFQIWFWYATSRHGSCCMTHGLWFIDRETRKACKKKAASAILENSYALSIVLFINNSSWNRRNPSATKISSLSYSSRKV